MNQQEIFDKAVSHLRAQGQKSEIRVFEMSPINRTKYWLAYQIPHIITYMLVMSFANEPLIWLLWLISLVWWITGALRRMKDINMSPWWIIVCFIPLAALYPGIKMGFEKGNLTK